MDSLSECSKRIVDGDNEKWNLDLDISDDDLEETDQNKVPNNGS